MQFSKPHDVFTKDVIWIGVENGGTGTIAKGLLCVWDTTDNSAVSGILMNTRGLRVIVCPTGEAATVADGINRLAGFAHTAMDGTAANTRGVPYLVQTYGFRDDISANTDANADLVVGGAMVPSPDLAGGVQGISTVGTPTATEAYKVCGFSFEVVAAASATVTIQAFIRLM